MQIQRRGGRGGVSILPETHAQVHGVPKVGTVLPGAPAEASPCLAASDVTAMSLPELAEAGLVVEVRSEVLGETVVFASDNASVDPGEQRVVYRTAELAVLVGLGARILRTIHEMKRTFGVPIVAS